MTYVTRDLFPKIPNKANGIFFAYNVVPQLQNLRYRREDLKQSMGVEYKDYYKILGVSRTATDKEIRSAYRKLARELHPDVNPSAADRFKEINEAYEALKDPEKRRLYDSLGSQWRQGQNYTPPPGFEGWQQTINMDDLGGFGGTGMGGFSSFFDALFGGMGGHGFGDADFPGARSTGRRHQGHRGHHTREAPPTEQVLHLDLEEVATGARKEITTPSGKRLTVRIPQGVKEGSKIRLTGEGTVGQYGQGDLFLVVRYRAHPHFRMEGDALIYEASVPVPDLVLGGEVRVPSFSGEISVRIPPGTQPGRLMRLKGQGMPGRDGQSAGDLLVRPQALIPKHPSDREKVLYRELRDLHANVHTEQRL